MSVQYSDPIRVNMPVVIGIYTFMDYNTDEVINLLTDFVAVSVYCQIKKIGDTWDAGVTQVVAGTIVSAAGGTVKVASYEFTSIGRYDYQFYCLNSAGDYLWGEPVLFDVVKNTENLLKYEQINP